MGEVVRMPIPPEIHDAVEGAKAPLWRAIEAEVLGHAIVRPEDAAQILALSVEDFAPGLHRELFRAFLAMAEEGLSLDDLPELVRRVGQQPGIVEALSHLTGQRSPNLPHRLRQLREHGKRRRIAEASRRLFGAVEAGQDLGAALEHLDAVRATEAQGVEPSWAEVCDQIAESLSEEASAHRVSTGLPSLDELLGGGLGRGWLCVVLAPPKRGKTALAVGNLTRAACEAGQRVLVVSLEMSAEDLGRRLLAGLSRIGTARQHVGGMAPFEHARALECIEAMRHWRLRAVSDCTSVRAIASRARSEARDGLDLVVVDYIQLVDNGRDNPVDDITTTTRGLKRLAVELGVPVVALSQPTKLPAGQTRVKPGAARGAQAIEADADVFLLPYLHERDEANPSNFRGADVTVDAFRHGAGGRVELRFDGLGTRFEEVP